MTARRIDSAYVAGFVAFLITAAISHLRATPYDNYVLLAQAWLHGHSWIEWPGAYIDALGYNGQHYIIEAPLPAVLAIPLVAMFGTGANQTIVVAFLAAVAVGAAWRLGERFGLNAESNAWICAFLLAGTDLLWCASLGDVWFAAHVSAACFTLLALAELAGPRRAWLVALWAACAFESRFSLIVALPIYWIVCAAGSENGFGDTSAWRRATIGFAAVLVPVGILWTWYNFARWGTWNDIGYTEWYHQDQAGLPTGSPFRLAYLPYQLTSFFVQYPTVLNIFPWLRPEMGGVALTWTSPALVLAFFARGPLRWILALWLLTILAAIPNFLYYVNGFAQFGMRHALDFEPFLVALMMLAVRDRFPRWAYVLVAYSVAVGLWGCWFWHVYVRPA
ncbi:MAG TPA: hypothetical protein VGK84_03335 [Candidatus Tumulicola sp.]